MRKKLQALKRHHDALHAKGREMLGANRFSLLLIMLCLSLFLYPYLEHLPSGRDEVFRIFLILLLMTVVYSLIDDKRRFIIGAVLGVPAIALLASSLLTHGDFLAPFRMLDIICLNVFTAVTILSHILKAGRVTREILNGAICVYLLMGVTWAVAYTLLESLDPGAFYFSGPNAANWRPGWQDFIYS